MGLEHAVSASDHMITYRMPSDIEAPATARRAVAEALRTEHRSLIPTAELAVSELISNSVLHGTAGEIVLEIEISHESVRLAVVDLGGGFERPLPPHEGPGGFGLGIVARLATDWGVDSGPPTTVWCRLEAPSAADVEPLA